MVAAAPGVDMTDRMAVVRAVDTTVEVAGREWQPTS